ncbi:tyrosine-type recombinase/integrase [Comamonas sp. J-3]|uniref:tyrosine-type recombinase/integrase n=1 Tax=Comamonas trifloxystrobinivorans TaxID=3350256 RepID=UPI0037284CC2
MTCRNTEKSIALTKKQRTQELACGELEIPSVAMPEAPPSSVLIDLWLDSSTAASRSSIGISNEDSYRYFWNTWIKFLASLQPGTIDEKLLWQTATPELVLWFLQSGTKPRKKEEGVSAITRRRYWRLLERIYDFALGKHWIASNPALGLRHWEKPAQEKPKGAILSAKQWQSGLALLGAASGSEPIPVRNRAILLCLYETGITPEEIRALTLESCKADTSNGKLFVLQIDGSGVNQRRQFHLSEALSMAMGDWLACREQLPNAHKTQHLFCSTHGRMMGADNLHLLVREHLLQANSATDTAPAKRLGPQVIRNTCIVNWVNQGTPKAQVVVWAGLKNEKGLLHLADHFNPQIETQVR